MNCYLISFLITFNKQSSKTRCCICVIRVLYPYQPVKCETIFYLTTKHPHSHYSKFPTQEIQAVLPQLHLPVGQKGNSPYPHQIILTRRFTIQLGIPSWLVSWMHSMRIRMDPTKITDHKLKESKENWLKDMWFLKQSWQQSRFNLPGVTIGNSLSVGIKLRATRAEWPWY